jgi:poly [ADP-ribose] polymerase 2/3/4
MLRVENPRLQRVILSADRSKEIDVGEHMLTPSHLGLGDNMGLKEVKAHSEHSGSYSETLEFSVLACGNITGNNNKFYCLEIQRDPATGEHRLFSHYGRINTSNVYGIRGPYHSQSAAKSEYDAIIKKKLRGKNIKTDNGGHHENYELVDVVSPTVGSTNIRGAVSKTVKTSTSAAHVVQAASKKFVPDVQRLIKQFADENIHRITGSTSLVVTDQGLETALGKVTSTHVDRARAVLMNLKDLIQGGRTDPSDREVATFNNEYLSLVPRTVGRKIQRTDMILGDQKLIEEFDLLDQLSAAVQLGITKTSNVVDQFSQIGVDIDPVSDPKVSAEIARFYEKSRASNHGGLYRWRVKNAYAVKIHKERERFEARGVKLGSLLDLWHGSRNCNLLSILLNGLIIPPVTASFVCGRMFGNGVYFAPASTKSLNYSTGSWAGKQNKYPNAFLLLNRVALGNTYVTKSAVSSGVPRGYDSIHAKASKNPGYGGGLYNDEIITRELHQSTITFLVELQQ